MGDNIWIKKVVLLIWKNDLNTNITDNISLGFGVDTNGVTIPHWVGSTVETDILAVFDQLKNNHTWMGFVRNDSTKQFCIIAKSNTQGRGVALLFYTHKDGVRYYRFQGGAIVKDAHLDMTDVTS